MEMAALLEVLQMVGAENFPHNLNSFRVCPLLRTDGHYITMHPHFWGFSFTDVRVGPAMLNNHAEKLIKVSHVRSRSKKEEVRGHILRCWRIVCFWSARA